METVGDARIMDNDATDDEQTTMGKKNMSCTSKHGRG